MLQFAQNLNRVVREDFIDFSSEGEEANGGHLDKDDSRKRE